MRIPESEAAFRVERDPPLARALAIVLGAILLCWPALLNRYPLLYPDSIGYLQDGRPVAAALFLHRLANFTAQRAELYSLGILLFHWNLTPWPIVALNALLTAYVLWLVVCSIVPCNPARNYLLLVAFLSLFTSVSWFVSLLMPDLLGALLYLAIYLLIFARETLSRVDRCALALIALWAITAHATHLMLAAGLCVLLALLLAFRWKPIAHRGRALAQIAILVALAAAAQLALHAYLYGRPSLDGSRPPYLMARIIADGPGREYLSQHCATLNWAICDHVHNGVADLPDNDDAFLWEPGGVWPSASKATQQRLLAEEMPLVRATLRAYPHEQLARSFANFTHQLNDFGVNDFDNNAWMQSAIGNVLRGAQPHYLGSLQARDAVPSNLFTTLQRWVAIPSALLLAALLPYLVRHRRQQLLGLIAVVVPVLIANALVTAVLSSSDSRYQARVIWLVPLAAALAVLDLPQRAQFASTAR
jgi:hypothetical protein